jgi:hypothetical protein
VRRLFILVLVALSSSGCAYVLDRGLDFEDIFRVTVSYGPGIGVQAKATEFVQLAAGREDCNRTMVIGRALLKPWDDRYNGSNNYLAAMGDVFANGFKPWKSRRDYFALVVPFNITEQGDPDNPAVVDRSNRLYDFTPDLAETPYATHRAGEVFVGFHLFLIGHELGLDPVEFIDWIVGFTTIDILGDDRAHVIDEGYVE